jgi:hypothetical protein
VSTTLVLSELSGVKCTPRGLPLFISATSLMSLSCGAIASGTVSRDPVPSMLSVQTMLVMR